MTTLVIVFGAGVLFGVMIYRFNRKHRGSPEDVF
jgi:hypothetical protein